MGIPSLLAPRPSTKLALGKLKYDTWPSGASTSSHVKFTCEMGLSANWTAVHVIVIPQHEHYSICTPPPPHSGKAGVLPRCAARIPPCQPPPQLLPGLPAMGGTH